MTKKRPLKTPEGISATLSRAERLVPRNPREAEDLVRGVLDSLEDPRSAEAVEARLILASARGEQGNYADATSELLRLLAEAEALGRPRLVGRALNSLGIFLDITGQLLEAADCYQQAIALHQASGDRWAEAQVTGNLGVVWGRLGDAEEALVCLDRALALAEGLDLGPKLLTHRYNRAFSLIRLGRFDEAEETLRVCRAHVEQLGVERMLPALAIGQGLVHLGRGDASAAADRLEAAAEMSRSNGQPEVEVEARRDLAKALARVDRERAVIEARAALRLAERVELRSECREVHELLAEMLSADDPDAARTHMLRALELGRGEVRELAGRRRDWLVAKREAAVLKQDLQVLETNSLRLGALLKEKEEIMGIASHDLRNTLTAMLLLADELQVEMNRPRPREVIGRDVETSTRYMQEVVTNLLQSHEIESGEQQVALTVVPVADAVHNALLVVEPAAKIKHIRLSAEGPEIEALADRCGLEQALVNLVGNAVKFSKPDTDVETVIEPHDGVVRIHVLDRGPGLNSDDLERAFRKFARLSARPTAGESSTGLGLYITRRLLERMGGQVEAGVRPGGGARFTVTLPRAGSIPEGTVARSEPA